MIQIKLLLTTSGKLSTNLVCGQNTILNEYSETSLNGEWKSSIAPPIREVHIIRDCIIQSSAVYKIINSLLLLILPF